MISPERLAQLLESYGGREENWPRDLRESMQVCLDAHPETRSALMVERELDALLGSYEPAQPDLSRRILAAIPESRFDRLLAWLLPESPAGWWRPALAGVLPLMLGVAIGLGSLEQAQEGAGTDWDWEIQERNLLASPALGDWYE